MHSLWFPVLVFAVLFQGVELRRLMKRIRALERQKLLLEIHNEELIRVVLVHLQIYKTMHPMVPVIASLGG